MANDNSDSGQMEDIALAQMKAVALDMFTKYTRRLDDAAAGATGTPAANYNNMDMKDEHELGLAAMTLYLGISREQRERSQQALAPRKPDGGSPATPAAPGV